MRSISPKTQSFMAVILFLTGVGLLIAGFIVPPTGIIDPSVLVAFGEVLTWVATIIGVDYHFKTKRQKIEEDTE